ncbi:hypothetical protein GRI89_06895 [Altererythrobacter salegens]|uniref:Uncharacterized protein n=2 Tax=Croceibacterium salegens TaxID=1737568 RepID=A0A6I4STN8_9SPHN|nr:hypothetical protein [Croceibacterium salegens]
MALASASPAMARDRDHDGIDAGDIIAGALIIGGIAAVASATSNDREFRRDDYPYRGNERYRAGYGYHRGGNSRQAVEQCVRAAERNANRYSYGGRAKVTDIRDIDRKNHGYKVRGRIAVNTRNGDWRRGWGNDYRGYNSRYNGYDSGSFNCEVRYGRVVDLDYHGIRGL